MAEQRFRKPQAAGSSPARGSRKTTPTGVSTIGRKTGIGIAAALTTAAAGIATAALGMFALDSLNVVRAGMALIGLSAAAMILWTLCEAA